MAVTHRAIRRPTPTHGSRGGTSRHGNRQGGYAIVSVLLLTLLVLVTGAFTLTASLQARTFSGRSGTAMQARNVAEGGIDFAMAALNSTIRDPAYANREGLPAYFVRSNDSTWTYADASNGYFFRSTFNGMVPVLTITIPATPPVPNPQANDYGFYYRIISSRVAYKGVQQWVQAVVRLNTSKAPVDNAITGRAITSRTDITPNGNTGATLTDSYDSRFGPYDPTVPGSQGSIYAGGGITSGAVVNGSASASGSIDPRLSVQGTGNTSNAGIAPLPIADAPPTPSTMSVTWRRGDVLDPPDDGTAYDLGTVSLSGTSRLTLKSGRYVMSSLTTTGNNAALIIDADSGPVEIYVTGRIQVTGQGIVNPGCRPTSLVLIAATPMAPVNIAGNGNFYGVVYAPANPVAIGGNGQFFGSVTGDSVSVNGNNATVHYDESIGGTMVIPSTITMAAAFQVVALDIKDRQ